VVWWMERDGVPVIDPSQVPSLGPRFQQPQQLVIELAPAAG
jgi:hypothetical protein